MKELCDEQVPFSGVYLNDIGITKGFINSVITKDYDSIEQFVEGKISHAITVVKTAIHAMYGNRINSTSLIHNHRLGYTQDDLVTKAGGDWKGIQIKLNNFSNFINMELSGISLHVNTNGTVPVYIYDLYQDKLLETINVTAVSGKIVTVYPHKIIQSEGKPLNLFIGYNAAGITSITTYIRDNQCCGIVSCNTSFMRAVGVTNSTGTFIDEDMTDIAHTAGLSLVYSLSCDPYAWMCAYAQALALPIAYKVASEIYRHGMNNPMNRSSNNVNLNTEQMEKMQKDYEFLFREQMDSILHNISVPQDSVCFQCKTPAKTAVVLP